MTSVISTFGILDYISSMKPWKIEAANEKFYPNTEKLNWKPWHHVYSNCKCGKGQAHHPKYNPGGIVVQ